MEDHFDISICELFAHQPAPVHVASALHGGLGATVEPAHQPAPFIDSDGAQKALRDVRRPNGDEAAPGASEKSEPSAPARELEMGTMGEVMALGAP